MPTAALPPDPIRLQQQLHWRAARARWRADPVSAAALALVWCAVLAAGLGLGWSLVQRHGAVLLAFLAAHLATCTLVAFAMALVDVERALLRAERRWRRGWLAGLAGLQPAVPRQLTGAALRRAALHSAGVLLVPPLLGLAVSPRSWPWPAGWWLVMVAPWLAALLARVLASRRRASPAQGLREQPAATWIVGRLPVAARWQWAAWARAQRGRAAAWLMLPLLLAVPAGMSGPATVLALACAFAVAALLTLWSTALLQLPPRAAALLRATPCSAPRFLAGQLLLPALLLVLATGGLAMLLACAAGWMAAALALVPLSAAVLHAGVVCAERHRPRRIGPLLALQLALPLALLQAMPPLVPLLLLLQVIVLARRALRQ